MKGNKTIAISLMIIGGLLFLVGFYFNFMEWPDLFKGTISGSVIFIIGLILFIMLKVKRRLV
jgi:hypothetical protein